MHKVDYKEVKTYIIFSLNLFAVLLATQIVYTLSLKLDACQVYLHAIN